MHAKQMQALDAIPRDRRRVRARRSGATSGGLVRGYRAEDAETIVVALGSVLGHDRGRRRRAARRRACRSARSGSSASGRSRSTRSARRSAGAKRVVVLEKAFAVGAGGIVGQNVRLALSGIRRRGLQRGRRARRPADHEARRCAALFADALADRLEPAAPSSTWTARRRRARAGAHAGRRAARARTPRTSSATSASSPPARTEEPRCPTSRSSSTRSGSFVVGNRLLDPEQRSVQARHGALEHAHLRAPRLPGLRRGARRPLRRSTPRCGPPAGKLVAANATGCLEVFSTPYPESSWQLPWIHSLFGNAPGGRHRDRRGAAGQGPRGRARGRPGRRRRHRRHRLRLPVGDVRAQRRRALHLLRQRGLHEHRRAALRARRRRRRAPRPPSRSGTSPATSSARARTRR